MYFLLLEDRERLDRHLFLEEVVVLDQEEQVESRF